MMFLRLLTMNDDALGYFTIQQCGELFSFEFCKENRNVIKFNKFICEWHTKDFQSYKQIWQVFFYDYIIYIVIYIIE